MSSKPDIPGSFEQSVLLAILQLGDDAYGMTVRREIAERTGRDVALGAVYSTLDRLEEKGWIRSAPAPGGVERAGRPRRLVKVLGAGRRALQEALHGIDALRAGLPGLEPAGATP